MWKIPEESQLIFRAHDRAVDCARYVTGTEWVSGGVDGSVHLWSQMKKRPVFVARSAHGPKAGGAGSLSFKGALPQRGFVNGLSIARSARFVLAAVGQEPRMGRWARDAAARNGLALHMLRVE